MRVLLTLTRPRAVGTNRPTLDCLRTRNAPRRIKLGSERKEGREEKRRQKRGDNFMPDGWFCVLPVRLSGDWTDCRLSTALLKGIRRNEAKPFLGENVATHRFRRCWPKRKWKRTKRSTRPWRRRGKERRGEGERKEYKELLLRPWQPTSGG